MLVSGVEQSDSHTCYTYTCIYSSFKFFSHVGFYIVLSRVPCATQQATASQLSYFTHSSYMLVSLCYSASSFYKALYGMVVKDFGVTLPEFKS